MSFITSLATAAAPHALAQTAVADFMVRAMSLNDDQARQLRALYRATGIDKRHSVLADYGRAGPYDFFANTPDLEPFPTTRQRMEVYQREAIALSMRAAAPCLQQAGAEPGTITHLVVASCTGMYAPGLDIDLVKALGLPTTVQRTCINFMGCYAAFNALKVADAFCRDAHAHVLVVCTELCSLHFQKQNTPDNWLANALFADGAAAVLVEPAPRSGVNLRLHRFFSDLALEGQHDMAWHIGDAGFEMKLSTYVPDILETGLMPLTQSLLRNTAQPQIKYWAVHPGGRRIVEAAARALGLNPGQTQFSLQVLRQFGNMSSATVLFVLHDMWQQAEEQDHGQKLLGFAFGPGLTMESMLGEFQYVTP
jgi:predicted naringenin-chalcone synthase